MSTGDLAQGLLLAGAASLLFKPLFAAKNIISHFKKEPIGFLSAEARAQICADKSILMINALHGIHDDVSVVTKETYSLIDPIKVRILPLPTHLEFFEGDIFKNILSRREEKRKRLGIKYQDDQIRIDSILMENKCQRLRGSIGLIVSLRNNEYSPQMILDSVKRVAKASKQIIEFA